MSLVIEAMVAKIQDTPSINAIVLGRVFPAPLEQGSDVPAVTIGVMNERFGVNQDGPEGLGRLRYEVSAFAPDTLSAHTLAKEIRKALNGWQGVSLDIQFQGVFVENFRDDYADEAKHYIVRQDLIISAEEA